MTEKKQIAIVDDHAMFRNGLKALINIFPGYQVLFDAANGNELIEHVKAGKIPHIVLMDISMPEMDGYAATVWLTNNYPQIKVLALSTMDSETAIIKMIKSGAKGYVLKDADTEELQRAFDEVINRDFFYNETITRKVLNAVVQLTDSRNKTGTFANFSDRELEFLRYTSTELTYKEIAEKMFLSVRTVEGYRDSLCEKLSLKTRVGLAMYAIKNGLATL